MPTSTETPVPTRVYYFDYLRVFATAGVVILHAGSVILTRNNGGDVDFLSRFNIGNAYNSLGRFAVNCFFMISGALLLAPLHKFRLRQQTLRVALPLLTWSAIYVLTNAYLSHQHLPVIGGSNDNDGSLASGLNSFIVGPLAYHLWFVYVLVGIYLVIPLLRPITALPEATRANLLRYALILWAIFTVAIPTIHQISPSLTTPYEAAFPDLPAGYLGFVLLGFYLHHHAGQVPRKWLMLGAVTGLFAVMALVFFEEVQREGSLWPLGNFTPQVILFSACMFLLTKATFNRPGRYFSFISLTSHLSFRIYLVHALVLHVLRSLTPLKGWYNDQPLVSVPVITALTLAVSFAIAWSLDRIKPIRAYI